MDINKKIMMFCAVSLIAICVFLADRGTASKENENVVSTVQENVSTGAAVISSVSTAAVQEAEENQMAEETKADTVENGTGRSDHVASETDVPEPKNGDAITGSKKEQPKQTKNPENPGRKSGKTAVSDKKGSGRKEDSESTAGTGSDSNSETSIPARPKDAAASSVPKTPVSTPTVDQYECVLQITCSDVLTHMDQLNDSAKKMIPANGIILEGTWSFTEGDTAFDVLKKACAERDILIDYVFTPGFSTYYVKGINQLYEFDCGDESGWMYKVNGKKPDYGCSQYEVKKNDNIVFYYTCER